MSWIEHVAPEGAKPPLDEIYRRIRARSARGAVSSIWQVLGLDPGALEAVGALARGLVDDPAPLTEAQSELIAVVVSATNGCAYTVAHHGPRLARALDNEPLARAVARDYREANLAARDRVLLDAAVALTCEPSERKLEDIERLREYGFDDRAILKATAIAAYYNFINRLVSPLGIALEPEVAAWEFGAQK